MAATTSTTTTTDHEGNVTKIVNEWEGDVENKIHIWVAHTETVGRAVAYAGVGIAAFVVAHHFF